ncbi:hypothetical protein [Acrocarpospora phusangensis]|uniref:hypothetical protein n=1 Tax=Acrocarpospora phusangensis TaxID=1070424 RepID=UPI00195290F3|nr:hypothetical protein [Acrocarpospora phusangensis]
MRAQHRLLRPLRDRVQAEPHDRVCFEALERDGRLPERRRARRPDGFIDLSAIVITGDHAPAESS